MSYLALYRKFRPRTFDEVKGQDHIVTTLKNQLANNRVGHAYLFCGTRGTGKTTIAKLLARTVNCDNPTENGPCGECESCKAILNGSSLDVREIDAATNSGVDNIRVINENVRNVPPNGKHLVYIIDEAHQLSPAAFNAMLKTLEEPPEYAIFILATTDDYSVPVTIKSRCQRFDFHRISIDTIAARLAEVVEREGEKATEDALGYIARVADGSMRDALSVLDECMSASPGRELDKDTVLRTVGAVSVDVYFRLLDAILSDNPGEVLDIVNETIWDGKDLTKFSDDFTWFIRNMLFLKLSPNIGSELDMTAENVTRLKNTGAGISTEVLARYLGILQVLSADIRKSSVRRVTFEMAMIKLMHPESDVDVASLMKRVDSLERAFAGLSGAAPEEMAGSGKGLSDREVEALVDARLEKQLPKLIKEMKLEPPRVKAEKQVIPDELRSEYPDVDFSDEEQVARLQGELVDQNLRKRFPPAEYHELKQLSDDFKNGLRLKLKQPIRDFMEDVEVAPDESYRAGSRMKLFLVFYEADLDDNKVKFKYNYFQKEVNKDNLAEQLSALIEKHVEIDIKLKKGRKQKIDKELIDLTKMNFPVNQFNKEEERNG